MDIDVKTLFEVAAWFIMGSLGLFFYWDYRRGKKKEKEKKKERGEVVVEDKNLEIKKKYKIIIASIFISEAFFLYVTLTWTFYYFLIVSFEILIWTYLIFYFVVIWLMGWLIDKKLFSPTIFFICLPIVFLLPVLGVMLANPYW